MILTITFSDESNGHLHNRQKNLTTQLMILTILFLDKLNRNNNLNLIYSQVNSGIIHFGCYILLSLLFILISLNGNICNDLCSNNVILFCHELLFKVKKGGHPIENHFKDKHTLQFLYLSHQKIKMHRVGISSNIQFF